MHLLCGNCVLDAFEAKQTTVGYKFNLILFVLVTLVPYVLYKRENINAKYYKGENHKLMVCGKHS